MEVIMKILLFVLLLMMLNFALNFSRMILSKQYYRKFKKSTANMNEYTASVEHLFDKAGTNHMIAVTRYQGEKLSQCLCVDSFRDLLHSTFQKTIGIYRFRAINSFNPLYWFDAPVRFLKKENIELPGSVKLLAQLLFWTAAVIIGHCLELLFDAWIFPILPQVCQNILK